MQQPNVLRRVKTEEYEKKNLKNLCTLVSLFFVCVYCLVRISQINQACCVFSLFTSGHISPWKASKQVQLLNQICFFMCVWVRKGKFGWGKEREAGVRLWTRFVYRGRVMCLGSDFLLCEIDRISSHNSPSVQKKLFRFTIKLHLLLFLQSTAINSISQTI